MSSTVKTNRQGDVFVGGEFVGEVERTPSGWTAKHYGSSDDTSHGTRGDAIAALTRTAGRRG